MKQIHLGNTKDGKPFEIPVHHTGIFGQTGVGKTRELKYMARQAVDAGYSVLIIDSKIPHPEFKGFGVDVPLYLEESTDADVFRSLIEGMRTEGRGDMNRYRGGFIEICEPADDKPAENFKHIGARLEAKMHDKAIRGNTRVMYAEIRRDYKKLMDMIGKHDFARSLEIPRPIARMETRVLPNVALQGLILKSVVNKILQQEKDLIILVDEAPNFCHQKLYNPAKSALMALDAQGRSKGIFGWYSGQTLTGFDKSNMKNLWYWVVGREMETNEAKDAHAVQTFKRLTVDEIRRLPIQEFVAVTPEATERIRVPDVDIHGRLENGSAGQGLVTQKADLGIVASAQIPDELVQGLENKIAEQQSIIAKLTEERDTNRANFDEAVKHGIELATQLNKAREEESAYKRLKTALRDIWEITGVASPTHIANADGEVEINAEDVEVKVFETLREEKFDESTIAGKICIILSEGKWVGPLGKGEIVKLIQQSWQFHFPEKPGGKDYKPISEALELLSHKPYNLLAKNGALFEPTEKGMAIEKEVLTV